MFFLYILGAILCIAVIVFYFMLCSSMADIAEDKGHSRDSAFVYCLFLGILGFIYVLALPNIKGKQTVVQKINEVSKKETSKSIVFDDKIFKIEEINKTKDGDTIFVLKLYCENKIYDYKFTEGFRKRNTILEFIENCKQKNYDGADEYLDRLITNEKFVAFVNKETTEDKTLNQIKCPHCGNIQSKSISRCLSCSKMINE